MELTRYEIVQAEVADAAAALRCVDAAVTVLSIVAQLRAELPGGVTAAHVCMARWYVTVYLCA